jgi:hypothetical protein
MEAADLDVALKLAAEGVEILQARFSDCADADCSSLLTAISAVTEHVFSGVLFVTRCAHGIRRRS